MTIRIRYWFSRERVTTITTNELSLVCGNWLRHFNQTASADQNQWVITLHMKNISKKMPGILPIQSNFGLFSLFLIVFFLVSGKLNLHIIICMRYIKYQVYCNYSQFSHQFYNFLRFNTARRLVFCYFCTIAQDYSVSQSDCERFSIWRMHKSSAII